MPDYSKCTPDRVTEVRALLASDMFDSAVRQLREIMGRVNAFATEGPRHNYFDADSLEVDWDAVGIALRMTPYQAIVVVADPTPDIMDAVADSGRSFTTA